MSTIPSVPSRFDGTVANRATPPQKLVNIIKRMVREGKKELRVCLPGKIVALHNSYQVDVQPLLQSQFDGSAGPVSLPVLPDVPVSMPAGNGFVVQYPVSVGDTGLLIFADRALDAWLAGTGDLTDPQDARLHDLTDAIFVPSLLPTAIAATLADNSGDLVLRNGLGHVRVQKSGHVTIGNAQADLAKLVEELAQQVQGLATALATMATSPGKPVDPGASSIIAAASQIATQASTISGS